ncbi:2-C-methyl-D-erythritol 4-phosphate cytidylyltransferase [bacterium]|nr:2-C-methyl-D-erythritol 4-phosphate cytidylyltransferase [bacterium]|tara:strand:- start:202 stop:888 length:687 start_codon:yes stop_codon:yes gene_type:complete
MISPSLSFIVTAAGEGSRFGVGQPKQFKKINKIPIYIYSLLSINKINIKSEVFLTINKKIKIEKIEKELKTYGLSKVNVIHGGATRANSVYKAFTEIKNKKGYVVIHDSVRPNFDFRNLNGIIEKNKKFDGIIIASKIHDTVKRETRSIVKETLTRDELWLAETPQIFKYSILNKCYSNNLINDSYTDESQLLEKKGYKIKLYENIEYNNKITTKKDLIIYKKLLSDV